MKSINIFRVGISPPQPFSLNFLFRFSLCLLLLLCFTDVSNKYYHETGSDELSAQYKGELASVVWEHVV